MQGYDSLNGNSIKGYPSAMTLGEFMTDCANAGNAIVRFIDTDFSVGDLCSWRGSYDIPSITYDYEDKTGTQVFEQLQAQLKETHWGYKGGEFSYSTEDKFYVSEYGRAEEFMVIGTELEDGYLFVITKIIPY